MAIDTNIFPLFPQAATQTVAGVAGVQEVEVTGRVVTIGVAADSTDAIINFKAPVGLVFNVVAGTLGTSSTVNIKSPDGSFDESLDTAADGATLMALEDGGLTILAPFEVNDFTT